MKTLSLFALLSFDLYAQIALPVFYYDTEKQQLNPIDSNKTSRQVFCFSLKQDNFYDYLKIEYRKGMHLFIDGVLKHSFKEEQALIISIDSLRRRSATYKNLLWLLFLETKTSTPPRLVLTPTFETAQTSTFIPTPQPKSILFWIFGLLTLAWISFSRFQKNSFLPSYFSNISHISDFLNKEKVYYNLKSVEILFFTIFFSLLFALSHALWWENDTIQLSTSTDPLIVFAQVWLLGFIGLVLRFGASLWVSQLYRKKELFWISNNLFIHFAYGFQILCLTVLVLFNFIDFNLIPSYRIGLAVILILFPGLLLISLLRFFTIPFFHTLSYFFCFELSPVILIAIYIFKN